MPRKPGFANGSDSILSHPEFSGALIRCAALRRQFLDYFTDGVLIGECLLSEPCPAHLSCYVLPDRILMILVNDDAQRALAFTGDLNPWLASTSGNYAVTVFGENGQPRGSLRTPSKWQANLGTLAAGEMRLFEIRAQ